MRDNKGFTLIEILFVISLMILLLSVAVISYLKVSNDKKNEAWELVKKEIEEAAKEYFVSNEYLFEGLEKGSTGIISVGKLVEEDYLLKVVNPKTNKTISYCALVKVSKEESGYQSSFDESTIDNNTTSCDYKNTISVSEVGAPSAKISYLYNDESHDNAPSWFNMSHSNPKIKVVGITNGNGKISTVKIENNIANGNTNVYDITDETNYKKLNIEVTNQSGKKYITQVSYRRDITKPSGSLNITSSTSWNSKNVKLSFDGSDNLSGINIVKLNDKTNVFNGITGIKTWSRSSYSYTLDGNYNGNQTKTLSMVISDVSGNESVINSNTYTLYTKCQTGNMIYDGDWYNKRGVTCSKTCGTGYITQERKRKDKNSGDSCPVDTREAKCNTQSCTTTKKYTITKISGVDSKYCSLRNPWGYSTKKYNESITKNNCRDTNNNPRVEFSNISGSVSGTTATIKVSLNIYSTSWEMLGTSSNSGNARSICISDGNKFSTSKCVSNSVEIKSKSATWKSNSHVLNNKTITLTVNNVNKYDKLAFKIYSPGKGVNANPTCTHSSGYNCKTSTGSPFIFQSAYLFEVN